VLPASDSQCFARFNVTKTVYERLGTGSGQSPSLTDRYTDHAGFELASSTWLSFEELPNKLKRGRQAHLLLDVDCTEVAGSSAEVAESAGF
jgi:hypothetical protein